MTLTRSSYVRLLYNGNNITRDIAPFLTNFSFTDNSSSNSDDISFTLEDREAQFIGPWFPDKGAKIKASIIQIDGQNARALPCGEFEIDQLDFSAPPRTLNVKAVACANSKSLRNEAHYKNWENISLQQIAAQIAADNGYKLWFNADNPMYERKSQVNIPDLQFLHNLCIDNNLNIKCRDFSIVIYDDEANSNRAPAAKIDAQSNNLISWKFQTKNAKVYNSANVNYHDPNKNQTFNAKAHDDNVEGAGETLEIYERVESQAEAELLATKRLARANRSEISAKLTLIGNVDLLAGNIISLSGFGVFDGNFIIDKALHSISNGYTTSIDASMGKSSKSAAKSKKKSSAAKPKVKKLTKQHTPELYYSGTRYYGHED